MEICCGRRGNCVDLRVLFMADTKALTGDFALPDLMIPSGESDELPYDTRFFSVHDVQLRVRSNSSHILNSIAFLLSFFESPRVPEKTEIDFLLLKCSLKSVPLIETIRKVGRLLFDSNEDDEQGVADAIGIPFRYYGWKNLYMADFDSHGALVLDIDRGVARGLFPDPDSIHSLVFSSYMFSFAFSEILRSRGAFLMHAATVAVESKGVVIPAYSGSGKTTLALALCRGGFNFLSDDRSILRLDDGNIEVLAFPEGVDVTEQTISFFPELNNLTPDSFTAGLRKKKFWIEDLYPGRVVNRCIPRLLLFPTVINSNKSFLEPLSKIEAIGEMLPHSLVVIGKDTAEKHFQVLCRLVESTDCYRVHFGSDFSDVHKLVRQLLL